MRLLLDECLPRKLRQGLPGHEVLTVPEMGWAGIKNGALLSLIDSAFDVFVTIDGNLQYQQNLNSRKIALILLSAPDNTLETLLPMMARVLLSLATLQPGQLVRIDPDLNSSH